MTDSVIRKRVLTYYYVSSKYVHFFLILVQDMASSMLLNVYNIHIYLPFYSKSIHTNQATPIYGQVRQRCMDGGMIYVPSLKHCLNQRHMSRLDPTEWRLLDKLILQRIYHFYVLIYNVTCNGTMDTSRHGLLHTKASLKT